MKKLTKLIINRKFWGTGKRSSKALYDATNHKYCCLGFYSKACGFENKELNNEGTPEELVGNFLSDYRYDNHCDSDKLSDIKDLPSKFQKILKLLGRDTHSNSKICRKLMSANDNPKISDKIREKRISGLFKKIGVAVEYKGKYPANVKYNND